VKKYLVAAALIAGFSVSALALETNFIMFDNTTKKCVIMTTEPTDKTRYKMMGKYDSADAANKAMSSMKECG
jgi:hypothetical protein